MIVTVFLLSLLGAMALGMKDALGDGARAIRMVRANAKKWGVDPDKIGLSVSRRAEKWQGWLGRITMPAMRRRPILSREFHRGHPTWC